MQIFPTRMCNVTVRRREHWLMALVGRGGGRWGWGRNAYSAFPANCSVSYLSFVYGRNLWEELNGGENSLHWKANMLPLLSIMTQCQWPISYRIKVLPANPIISLLTKFSVENQYLYYIFLFYEKILNSGLNLFQTIFRSFKLSDHFQVNRKITEKRDKYIHDSKGNVSRMQTFFSLLFRFK